MKSIENKFKGSRGIMKTKPRDINGEKGIPYCSYPFHQGILSQGRIEYKNCLDCKYFKIYTENGA